MGDAIVADVGLTLAALVEAVPESEPPGAGAEPRPGRPRDHRPAERLDRPRRPPRSAARGRDRRPRVALLDPRAAQPAAPLAPRLLLLQRRRRPRLRPRRLDRRADGGAEPAGRLRARRGLGPVRDHRLLERRRLRRAGHLPGPAQRGVRDPQVVRRSRADHRRARPRPAEARRRRGRRGLRRQRPPGQPTATGSRGALADGARLVEAGAGRSPGRARACRSSRPMAGADRSLPRHAR